MKKGISLAVLSIVILVTVILATAATTTGSMALNGSKKIKFSSEIALVQELVNEYKKQNGMFPVSTTYDIDLTNVTSSSVTQFDDEPKNGNVISLEEIDFSLLPKTNLIYGNKKDSSDIYAVSYTTGKVYYLKGVKLSKITYYSLTDDLKELIGYIENVNNNNNSTKDGFVFEQSTTEWTNQSIDSTLKVPVSSDITNVTVYVLQNGTASMLNISESTDGYNVYNITGITSNYDVRVEYYKNSNYATQNFSVTNFDNVSPTFSVTQKQSFINQEEDIKQNYIDLNIDSDVSGIKMAKYETNSISFEDSNSYFSDAGKNISNNTIIVDRYVKYVTIYLEDNAGNYSWQIVELDVIVSEKDYVQNGLVLHYDGINNTGSGHSNTATVWKDLSLNGNDVILNSDNTFDNNSCVFVKTANSGFSLNNPLKKGVNDGFTIECVAISNETETSENEEYDLYSWFWNIRDEISEEKYMEFFRDYRGDYVVSVHYNNSNVIRNSIKKTEITNSQIVVANSKIKHFFDGILTGEETSSNEILNAVLSINSLDLGYANWFSGNNVYDKSDIYLDGNIYSFRIYNRALTEEEIQQNYKIDKLRYGL